MPTSRCNLNHGVIAAHAALSSAGDTPVMPERAGVGGQVPLVFSDERGRRGPATAGHDEPHIAGACKWYEWAGA